MASAVSRALSRNSRASNTVAGLCVSPQFLLRLQAGVLGERWALTGEAGLFLDPFYSPGSDFIGISNTYITDLIARDRQGIGGRSGARVSAAVFLVL